MNDTSPARPTPNELSAAIDAIVDLLAFVAAGEIVAAERAQQCVLAAQTDSVKKVSVSTDQAKPVGAARHGEAVA